MPRLSPSEDAPDRKLVQGLNEGDEEALATLYDEYGERLYDYALSMAGDEKVAAGIVHDTFIDAGRRAPRMRDHLHLSSWLYGAARRRCIRRGRPAELHWDRDAEFSDTPFVERADTVAATDWPPSGELHDLLRTALAALDPVDQEVVLLAFRHELPPARLGAAVGLSGRRAAARVRQGGAAMEAALAAEIARAARACAASADDADDADDEEPAEEATRSDAVAVLAARAPEPKQPAISEDDEEEPEPEAPPARGGGPLSGALWRTLHRGGRDASDAADPSLAEHIADCPACRSRGRVRAAALLRRAPAPVLPAALRHRVMHTATDPELAGYRADIAARGGPLTPEGLPSQPDVPSPFTRRWLFTGGGMVGALVAAVVAGLLMGPGVGGGALSWPPFHNQPTIKHEGRGGGDGREHGDRRPGGPAGGPGAVSGSPGATPSMRPQTDDGSPSPSPSGTVPPSSAPPSPPRPPARPGVLVVSPGTVEMYGTKTAQVSLSARNGPVTWTAMTSNGELVLSQMQGGVAKGGTSRVTITLRTALIGLPGQGTLTFTDSEGAAHQVTVKWGASLL
ncbi:RNA polymerase sigma factor [Actinomadura opuntiae]|uniref:RNA polymerase sigma factor n=1 Tax=Actinomadura sp. OS1-43 TaxID=604315 RepID=UPI00255B2992|nr:RNA polymerase sigma factor [Actinomadura sp. OS1-43]MDL4816908.1 RNA polymerase sigma factor [Actinomadura sp. OS1-43]